VYQVGINKGIIKIKLSISVVIRHIILSNSSPLEQSEHYNIHNYMHCTCRYISGVCPTAKQRFIIRKTSWLKALREMMATYCENHTEHIKTPYRETADICSNKSTNFPLSLGNGRSPHGHINQRLQIKFRAPDDKRCEARNMLSLQ